MAAASGGGGRGWAGAMSAISDVAKQLESSYRETTSKRLRMLDMFLVFVFATGVLQVGRLCVRRSNFRTPSVLVDRFRCWRWQTLLCVASAR